MLIIDRFENGFAVVEDSENNAMLSIPLSELPAGAREGSVLKPTENGYTLKKDDGARAEKIKALFERLKKKE
jgi:hypothetical protein